jgi:hypothetical protein
MEAKTCINCGRTEDKAPLLNVAFKGGEKFICAQCLPILIHKVHLLADKLPGVEIPPPSSHS